MSIVFPDNLDTLTNPVSTDTLDSPSHAGQHSDLNDAVEALEAKVGADSSAVTTSHDYQISAGWISAGETWTYASADDPTYTFTISGDLSAKYSAGMKIKLTQTTVKYFIITKVAYVDPNTTITVYGGTDYDLVSATITSPYYSMVKAPQGFPLDPDKWSVIITTVSGAVTPPTSDTWYNFSSFSCPIGIWEVKAVFEHSARNNLTGSSTKYIYQYINLSETSASATAIDARFDVYTQHFLNTAETAVYRRVMLVMSGVYEATSKTSIYLNSKVTFDGALTDMGVAVVDYRFVCAYL